MFMGQLCLGVVIPGLKIGIDNHPKAKKRTDLACLSAFSFDWEFKKLLISEGLLVKVVSPSRIFTS